MVDKGSKRWHATAVGYFLGKKPYFPHLEAFAKSNWKGLQRVSATTNGFYFFQFQTMAYMEEIIEEGPWLFQGQPIVLQAWEQGLSLRRQKHSQIPVWIRIRHLPMEYWTVDGLSAVASGVGIPLYTDKITQSCSRLDFARVCVMIKFHSKLPKHLVIISPILSEGKEVPIKVDIDYEWLPQRCMQCFSLGHSDPNCPEKKVRKASVPVSVYVQKPKSTPVDIDSPYGPELASDKMMGTALERTHPTDSSPPEQSRATSTAKGKELVVYNPFEILGDESSDLLLQAHSASARSGPILSSPRRNPHDKGCGVECTWAQQCSSSKCSRSTSS
ncbi:UNVERIFIED_CONTAM: hypothetical protein Sradi_6924600 [Sesamum radiatum]|uniref:DUF4283 domain-containing protein n=1 Tax=Sesamum radiatum TaxID=300843 RepID=A0AAW2JIY7_SESRA